MTKSIKERDRGLDKPWTELEDHLLVKLWGTGIPCIVIGRKLGRTKNAVIGRKRRLALGSRPSPIKVAGSSVKRKAIRAKKITLAPLSSNTPEKQDVGPDKTKSPPTLPDASPKASNGRENDYAKEGCQYPLGPLTQKSKRFCNAPRTIGKPYCPKHCSIAYVGTERRL